MDNGISNFVAQYGGSDGYSVPGYFDTHYYEWKIVGPNVTGITNEFVRSGRYEWSECSFKVNEPGQHSYVGVIMVHQTLDPSSPILETASMTTQITPGA